MQTKSKGTALMVITLIALLGMGAYAFADGGSAVPSGSAQSQGWANGGNAPANGNYGNRTMRGPYGPNMSNYQNRRGWNNGGHMPMMGTPGPGYRGNWNHGGYRMGPGMRGSGYGARNCGW